MHIFRPIKKSDIDELTTLAMSTEVTLPSLPKNKQKLLEKIDISLKTFEKATSKISSGCYLFVLEDITRAVLLGTSGIKISAPKSSTNYHYKIEKTLHENAKLGIKNELDTLHLISSQQEPSEICALYLTREARHGGFGKLLSYSRFLFMAAFPDRFNEIIMALIRGIIDEKGNSPFRDSTGRHILNKEISEAEALYTEDKNTLDGLTPKYPIYLSMLPTEVQQTVGQAHKGSIGALRMLQEEGFTFANEIDLFDGGPRITHPMKEILTIRESVVQPLKAVCNEDPLSPRYLLSNERLDFRACYGSIDEKNGLTLSKQTAEALQLKIGDPVRRVILTEGHHYDSQH